MRNDTASTVEVNSACGCDDCTEIRRLDALAARLGMAGPIDPPCPCLCGAVPCQSAWAGPLPSEGVPPAEWEAEGPSRNDDLFHLASAPSWYFEGFADWDLSPWEKAMEQYDRADDLFERWAREAEEERAMERRLGW